MKIAKYIIITAVLMLMAMAIIKLPPVKNYIQKQSDLALHEAYNLRIRYERAKLGS